MYRSLYTDQTIVDKLRLGGAERENALHRLYEDKSLRDAVKLVVINGGWKASVADEIFEDCLVQIDRLERHNVWLRDLSIQEILTDQAKKAWSLRLENDELIRNKVMQNLGMDKNLKKQVVAIVLKNNGSLQDAEDCYQNGIILLDSQLKQGKYRGGAINGFFYQICYNLWRNELKKTKSYSINSTSFPEPESTDDPLSVLEKKESAVLLKKLYDLLGASCQKILQLKYFIVDQYSMDEIAKKMGLKSAQNASNALSKCRKQLLKLLEKQKLAME